MELNLPSKKSFQCGLAQLKDFNDLNKFQRDIQTITNQEGRMRVVNALLNTLQPVVTQFLNSQGIKTIKDYLKDAIHNKRDELLEKIVNLLSNVTLTKEMMVEIGDTLLKLRDKQTQFGESVRGRIYKFCSKNRSLLDDHKHQRDNSPDTKKKIKPNEGRKDRKKNVRFLRDEDLNKYKIFRRDDEPNSKGLTPEELAQFLRQYAEDLKYRNTFTSDELKHLESQMEGRSHKQQQNTIDTMKEQVPFTRPIKLKLDCMELENQVTSTERDLMFKRNNQRIAYYLCLIKKEKIPREPEMKLGNNPGGAPPRVIQMSIPSNEDILSVITMICQNKEKECKQEQNNKNKKPLKGILKKPPGEKRFEQDQTKDVQGLLQKMTGMLKNRQQYQETELYALIDEMATNLIETGKPQFIKNIPAIVSSCINSEEQLILEKQIQQQKQLEQQRFIDNRMPMRLPYPMPPHFQPNQMPPGGMMPPPMMARPGFIPPQTKAYRTKPCMNYHSQKGCLRGESCSFIHDPNFKGVPIPPQALNVRPPNLFNQLIPNLSPQHQPQHGRPPFQHPLNNMQPRPSKYESL